MTRYLDWLNFLISDSRMIIFAYITFLILNFEPREPDVIHVAGVYQGKTLFIQNPYNPKTQSFCIAEVRINNRSVAMNTHISAIKLDFAEFDLYTPVAIEIRHDTLCTPLILNPDAISFHSTFSFKRAAMNDSTLTWSTAGDLKDGYFVVEKYQNGFWLETDTVVSQGKFEAADYSYHPQLEEGPNKFRIKYIFPSAEKYLYSPEVDAHYYPDPVTFTPFNPTDFLDLSRSASYEIYDGGSNLVLSGSGIRIDVGKLPRGDYVIYFDGSDPGLFRKK